MNELVRALRERSLSVQERLKVACHLWKQRNELLPGKHTILLKWTTEELCNAYNKRSRSPPVSREVCSQLWQLLAVEISSLLAQGQDIDEAAASLYLFQSMSEAFSEVVSSALEEEKVQCAGNALLVLRHVLAATKLPSILQKFELLVSMLQAVMVLALSLLKAGKTFDDLFPVLKMLLKYYSYLQGVQGNQKKVFTSACAQLLEPALLLLTSSSSSSSSSSGAQRDIQEELKLVLQAFFSRDHLTEFTSAVSPEADRSRETKRAAAPASYARLLFEKLHRLCGSSDYGEGRRQSVVEGVPVLLEAFLLQNSVEMKVSKNLEFRFFQKLLPFLDGAFSLEAAGEDDGGSLIEAESFAKEYSQHGRARSTDAASLGHQSLEALSQCLSLLHTHDVYQVREDSDELQFKQLHHIAVLLLRSTDESNLDVSFKCLAVMLNLNHKLVEPVLVQLWFIVLATEHGKWGKGLLQLVEQLIGTYAKLRQVPFLLSQLLEAVKLLREADSLSVSPVLPRTMEELLGSKVTELPPGQCVEVLQLLVGHLKETVHSEGFTSPPSDMEVDGSAVPDPTCVLPGLERAVDVCGVVLASLPHALWSGLCKEKATTLVVTLHSAVSLPLLPMAFVQRQCDRARCASLHLFYVCIELMLQIDAMFPALLLQSDLQLVEFWREKLLTDVWEELLEYSSTLSTTGTYLLNKLAVLLMNFSPGDRKENLLNFLFEECDSLSDDGSASWTGQVLDVTEANSKVANLSLIVSQLPFFYESCSEANLSCLASAIVTSLLLQEREEEEEEEPGGGWRSLHDVVEGFLASDGFLEMQRLHKLVLETCFTVATPIPKCLPKRIRKAFRPSAETGSCADSITTVLTNFLPEKEFETAGYEEEIDKFLHELTVFVKILNAVPLSGLQLEPQLKALLAVLVWNAAVTQLLETHVDDRAPAVMADLNYLVSWLLRSLSNHLSRPSFKKSKKAGTFEEVLVTYLDLWLSCLFKTATSSAQDSDAVALSSRVAFEVALSIRMKLRKGSLSLFASTVSSELVSTKQCGQSHNMDQYIHIIARTACKVYAGLHSSHKLRPDIASFLERFSQMVLDSLEPTVVTQLAPPSSAVVVLTRPLLVSSFVCLLHGSPSPTLSTRSVQVVSSLCQSKTLPNTFGGEDYQQLPYKLEAFNGMLDVLSLPAVIAKHPTVSFEGSSLPPASCQRLQRVLATIFEQCGPAVGVADLDGMPSSPSVSQPDGAIASVMLEKCSRVLLQLLVAADSKQISSIIADIFKQLSRCQSSPVSFRVFYFCWNTLFDARLSQECRVEMKKSLAKLLDVCCSKPVTEGSLGLAMRLGKRVVALPPQAGVDGSTALNAVQLISHITPSPATTADALGAAADLLATVVKQHAAAVNSTPGPVIVVLNKLIRAIVCTGELSDRQSTDASLVHCAEVVSHVMETLSQRKDFCKFVSYVIREFVTASQLHSLRPAVKKSFLPGVYSLLRVCSLAEVAFVKASLDSAGRDLFQALSEDYHKFGKKI